VASEGDGSKRLKHPEPGLLELDFSTFAVEARPDLSMIVYNAAPPRRCSGSPHSSRRGVPAPGLWENSAQLPPLVVARSS